MEDPYLNLQQPTTLREFRERFKLFNIEQYFKDIEPLIRPQIAIDLDPTHESDITLGQSKIGGNPDLPMDFEWPMDKDGLPHSFIAQINFSETKSYDKSDLLPKKGLVTFFYSISQGAWGFDPNDNSGFKTVYFSDTGNLVRTELPQSLSQDGRFKSATVTFKSVLSIPPWDNELIETIIDEFYTSEYLDVSSGVDYQILGYANNIQGSMELECQLVTNGLYCGDTSAHNDPRRKELEKNKDDWLLLLQIDSDEEGTGMMWGDCGRLYFWIRKQDLAKCDFKNVWCILQCT